ncbi:hypothetical protein HOY80DRAFT_983898 [Tuber brumale]|nr:hypothetical protein HOY80DRAFT_983898 [Tuber brumale]
MRRVVVPLVGAQVKCSLLLLPVLLQIIPPRGLRVPPTAPICGWHWEDSKSRVGNKNRILSNRETFAKIFASFFLSCTVQYFPLHPSYNPYVEL